MGANITQAAERLVQAYNAKDFALLETLIAADLDFAHFNRDFRLSSRDELLAVLKQFASDLVPDRRFEAPERVTQASDTIVIREGYWTGTAQVDLPGFAPAGGAIKLKFCSVLRFNNQGLLVEWKDYG